MSGKHARFPHALILAMPLVFAAAHATAQDSSCTRYIELTARMSDRPYRALQTITMGSQKMQSEAIHVDGTLYTRQGDAKTGKWMATPVPDLKASIELARKTTSKCAVSGTEMIDGVTTQVWISYATTPFEPKPVQWKTWIGTGDGRIYRQASEGFDQRYVYSNVTAPPASEIVQPRKKK
ncbi:MAG: hypothetical protein JNL19_02575 [Burkholderiales bacterium]|nr:hypothetical protein [Burkholderiales bacterium]